ncbi:MAG: polysaccharide deacetylase family protein [Clostridiales bacterium]|nr:polysaccharide deacetylase family protein [Clostridiales bacterium]
MVFASVNARLEKKGYKMKLLNILYLLIMMLANPYENDTILSLNDLQQQLSAVEYPQVTIQEEAFYEANEMGKVPVLMYHRVREVSNGYDVSWTELKDNLQRLYDNDFVAVNFEEYLQGEINIPQGKHPVIITFDDGDISQFRIIVDENGNPEIDMNSAVGILYDFYLNHTDFGFEASFFLNGNTPFGQQDYVERKVAFIEKNGLILGNHTLMHISLADMLTKEVIEKAVYDNEIYYSEKYDTNLAHILALPYGIYPKDMSIIEDIGYPTLKVGWKPEESIFSTKFNPYKINRIQNGKDQFQFEYWMDYFSNHPDELFTSDGDSSKITLPNSFENELNADYVSKKEIIIYEVTKCIIR